MHINYTEPDQNIHMLNIIRYGPVSELSYDLVLSFCDNATNYVCRQTLSDVAVIANVTSWKLKTCCPTGNVMSYVQTG